MTATVIFNDFRAPSIWRNRYRRSEYQIWDANLHHGDVRPFACPEVICNGSFQTIYNNLRDCACPGNSLIQPVADGFCAGTKFVIANGFLKHASDVDLCDGQLLMNAGAPVPDPFVLQTISGTCDNNESCDHYGVAYVITYVVDTGVSLIESAPSRPIGPVMTNDLDAVTVGWAAAAGALLDYNIVATRLYRTDSSYEDGTDSIPANNSEFMFVQEFPGANAETHVDVLTPHQLGAPLTTYEPMAFPAPRGTLVSVAKTADSVVVADSTRVYISLPGQPQFTYDGVVEIEDEIQDIVAINNTVFVLTNNRPVKIGFRHTDGAMSIDKQVINRKLPLKSRRSLSVYDNTVYFASEHSLYAWDTGAYGSDLAASFTPLVTPEQWKNLNPSSVVGTGYEFGYIFSSSVIDYSIMVEFGGDRTDTVNGTSMMPISFIDANCFGLDADGHILYADNQGLYRWDWRRDVANASDLFDNFRPQVSDTCQCCPWTIVMYFDNEGKNRFSKMRVEWDERSATHLDAKFHLNAFGNEAEVVGDLQIISSRGFSIPKFSSSQTFCVEVSGCGIMHEIRLATSNNELVSSSNNLIGNAGE